MPSRHNAAIYVRYREDMPSFNLFLTGYGSPEDMRSLCRLAFRANRRQIMVDPEMFVGNLFFQVYKRTAVYITQREEVYQWMYAIDLMPKVPTLRITSAITGEKEDVYLFRWLGPERPLKAKEEPIHVEYAKRRGRPSGLAGDPRLRQFFVPAPDHVDEATGKPVRYDELYIKRRHKKA